MVPDAVENQVVALPASGEILPCVINDVICADRPDQIHIPRTAYATDLGAEPLSDLHRERTHAARRTINEDLMPCLNFSLVTRLSSPCNAVNAATGAETGLLEGHVIRLQDQGRLVSTRILGKGPLGNPDSESRGLRVSDAGSEHLVTCFVPGHVPAHGCNLAGHIDTQSCGFWFEQACHQATTAFQQAFVKGIDRGRADFYQDLTVPGTGFSTSRSGQHPPVPYRL